MESKKEESGKAAKIINKPVTFTAHMECKISVLESLSYRAEFGMKNIASDRLQEMFMMTLMEKFCMTYVSAFENVMTTGSSTEIKMIMRDEPMFRAMKLLSAQIKPRMEQFIRAAAIEANEKKYGKKEVQILKPTPTEKSKFRK